MYILLAIFFVLQSKFTSISLLIFLHYYMHKDSRKIYRRKITEIIYNCPINDLLFAPILEEILIFIVNRHMDIIYFPFSNILTNIYFSLIHFNIYDIGSRFSIEKFILLILLRSIYPTIFWGKLYAHYLQNTIPYILIFYIRYRRRVI